MSEETASLAAKKAMPGRVVGGRWYCNGPETVMAVLHTYVQHQLYYRRCPWSMRWPRIIFAMIFATAVSYLRRAAHRRARATDSTLVSVSYET